MCHTDNRRVIKIKYHLPSIDNEGKIRFGKFEMKSDENLKVMWSTNHRYEIKDLIEMDATIVRSVDDTKTNLRRITFNVKD